MDFKVDVKYNGHVLAVAGTLSRGLRARLTGHPDDWTADEGTTIEIQTVYLHRFNEQTRRETHRLLSAQVTRALADEERFVERVFDAAREAGY